MWPAIISAAGSLLTTGINNANSQSNAAQSFQRQKELMSLQQQYAVENWNRENNYNKPEEQMKRLKAAGLNPDLVYGNGASGLQSGPIAAPTAPAAPMAQTIPMANPIMEGAQAALAINQAKKADAEGIGQNIENEYALKTLNDRIDQIAIDNNWKKEQTNQIKESTAKIMQETDMIVGQMNLMVRDQDLKEQELANLKKSGILMDNEINWFAACKQADIAQKLASAGYNRAMAHQVESMLPLLLTQQKLANGLSAIQFGLQNKFGEAQIWIDMISKGVGSLGSFVGSLIPSQKIFNVFKGLSQ